MSLFGPRQTSVINSLRKQKSSGSSNSSNSSGSSKNSGSSSSSSSSRSSSSSSSSKSSSSSGSQNEPLKITGGTFTGTVTKKPDGTFSGGTGQTHYEPPVTIQGTVQPQAVIDDKTFTGAVNKTASGVYTSSSSSNKSSGSSGSSSSSRNSSSSGSNKSSSSNNITSTLKTPELVGPVEPKSTVWNTGTGLRSAQDARSIGVDQGLINKLDNNTLSVLLNASKGNKDTLREITSAVKEGKILDIKWDWLKDSNLIESQMMGIESTIKKKYNELESNKININENIKKIKQIEGSLISKSNEIKRIQDYLNNNKNIRLEISGINESEINKKIQEYNEKLIIYKNSINLYNSLNEKYIKEVDKLNKSIKLSDSKINDYNKYINKFNELKESYIIANAERYTKELKEASRQLGITFKNVTGLKNNEENDKKAIEYNQIKIDLYNKLFAEKVIPDGNNINQLDKTELDKSKLDVFDLVNVPLLMSEKEKTVLKDLQKEVMNNLRNKVNKVVKEKEWTGDWGKDIKEVAKHGLSFLGDYFSSIGRGVTKIPITFAETWENANNIPASIAKESKTNIIRNLIEASHIQMKKYEEQIEKNPNDKEARKQLRILKLITPTNEKAIKDPDVQTVLLTGGLIGTGVALPVVGQIIGAGTTLYYTGKTVIKPTKKNVGELVAVATTSVIANKGMKSLNVVLGKRYAQQKLEMKYGRNSPEVIEFKKLWNRAFKELPRNVPTTREWTGAQVEATWGDKQAQQIALEVMKKYKPDVIGSTTILPQTDLKKLPRIKAGDIDIQNVRNFVGGNRSEQMAVELYNALKSAGYDVKLSQSRFPKVSLKNIHKQDLGVLLSSKQRYHVTLDGKEFVNIGSSNRYFLDTQAGPLLNWYEFEQLGAFKKTNAGIKLGNIRDQMRVKLWNGYVKGSRSKDVIDARGIYEGTNFLFDEKGYVRSYSLAPKVPSMLPIYTITAKDGVMITESAFKPFKINRTYVRDKIIGGIHTKNVSDKGYSIDYNQAIIDYMYNKQKDAQIYDKQKEAEVHNEYFDVSDYNVKGLPLYKPIKTSKYSLNEYNTPNITKYEPYGPEDYAPYVPGNAPTYPPGSTPAYPPGTVPEYPIGSQPPYPPSKSYLPYEPMRYTIYTKGFVALPNIPNIKKIKEYEQKRSRYFTSFMGTRKYLKEIPYKSTNKTLVERLSARIVDRNKENRFYIVRRNNPNSRIINNTSPDSIYNKKTLNKKFKQTNDGFYIERPKYKFDTKTERSGLNLLRLMKKHNTY